MASIKIKRGTRVQLNAAAIAGTLSIGEPYLITDENRFAVGVSASTYQDFVKSSDADKYNHIVDGDFDIWHEGTTQSVSGYGSDTMWINGGSGSTKVHSRQLFTLGQNEVPGNPKYYSRTAVTSVAGVGNYIIKVQKVEGVSTLSGKIATLSFYAKADSNKNIAVEINQFFGTGGSPSSDVNGIGSQLIALTTSWKKYAVTITVSSVSGKTLGTNNNDSLGVVFWLDSGSTYNTRSANLGQQSGTFDIARVRLVEGSLDGDNINLNLEDTVRNVGRYYEKSFVPDVIPANGPNTTSFASPYGLACVTTANALLGGRVPFTVEKRNIPYITSYGNSQGYGAYEDLSGVVQWNANVITTTPTVDRRGFNVRQSVVNGTPVSIQFHWVADARL